MAKSRPVHTNVLQQSHPVLDLRLGFAVEERFVTILNMWLRTKGEEIVPPVDYNSDMLLWRKMMGRFKRGDFRNTMDERKATRRIADWTLMKKCELVGEPYKPVDWSD